MLALLAIVSSLLTWLAFRSSSFLVRLVGVVPAAAAFTLTTAVVLRQMGIEVVVDWMNLRVKISGLAIVLVARELPWWPAVILLVIGYAANWRGEESHNILLLILSYVAISTGMMFLISKMFLH